MLAVNAITETHFDMADEATILRGPVLVITQT